MKAACIRGYDDAPALEEVPTPDPGPGEVLVRVAAASLNPLDVKIQKGYVHAFIPVTFPYTIGTDLAGVVERLGSEVTGWSVGDAVVARVDPSSGGAVAELAVVPASYLVRAPPSVSLEQAAGIPTAAATAWQALFETAELKNGQTVVVHAGAGGVGSFAIQLAHDAGARVVATASGDGLVIARDLGADQVIDYRVEDFTEQVSDIDLVLDTVGGETTARSLDVLRPGGVLVSIPSPPDEALAVGRDATVLGVFHVSDASLLEKVVDRVEHGTKILIDRIVTLDSLDEAFARQESGHARGKIILTM